MGKKLLIIFLVLLVLGGGFLFYKQKSATSTVANQVTMVQTATAQEGNLVTKVSADGYVRLREEKELKAEVKGVVAEVFLEVGDPVQAGEEILSLDDDLMKSSLEKAYLDLEEVEKNYQLLLTNFQQQDQIHSLRLAEAERNLEIAQLSLEQERINLANQEEKLKNSLAEAKKALQKAENNYENSQYLYKNNAISKQQLEESRESYEAARSNYQRLEEELKVLVERTIPNALELAQLRVENAQNSLEVLKASFKTERISETDLELARIKVEKIKREVQELENALKKVVHKSPVAGTLTYLGVKEGDSVAEGTTLARISNLKDLIVEVAIDEININEVKIGQQAQITSDAFAGELSGKLYWIAPVGEREGNIIKYKGKISLDNTQGLVKPGMFVSAEIITNEKEKVITLPVMAILGEENKYVYLLEDGKAVKREIETGLRNLSQVEVKQGIEVGEEVIIGPYTILKNLQPGQPVVPLGGETGKIPGEQ